ncbi:MAG: hypothetical protein EZS28_029506, partial [Streblomastix strix]
MVLMLTDVEAEFLADFLYSGNFENIEETITKFEENPQQFLNTLPPRIAPDPMKVKKQEESSEADKIVAQIMEYTPQNNKTCLEGMRNAVLKGKTKYARKLFKKANIASALNTVLEIASKDDAKDVIAIQEVLITISQIGFDAGIDAELIQLNFLKVAVMIMKKFSMSNEIISVEIFRAISALMKNDTNSDHVTNELLQAMNQTVYIHKSKEVVSDAYLQCIMFISWNQKNHEKLEQCKCTNSIVLILYEFLQIIPQLLTHSKQALGVPGRSSEIFLTSQQMKQKESLMQIFKTAFRTLQVLIRNEKLLQVFVQSRGFQYAIRCYSLFLDKYPDIVVTICEMLDIAAMNNIAYNNLKELKVIGILIKETANKSQFVSSDVIVSMSRTVLNLMQSQFALHNDELSRLFQEYNSLENGLIILKSINQLDVIDREREQEKLKEQDRLKTLRERGIEKDKERNKVDDETKQESAISGICMLLKEVLITDNNFSKIFISKNGIEMMCETLTNVVQSIQSSSFIYSSVPSTFQSSSSSAAPIVTHPPISISLSSVPTASPSNLPISGLDRTNARNNSPPGVHNPTNRIGYQPKVSGPLPISTSMTSFQHSLTNALA